MVNQQLRRATQDLRIFNLFSLEELINESQQQDSEFLTGQQKSINDNELLERLKQIVVETQVGCLPSGKLVNKIIDIYKDFEQQGLPNPLPSTVIPYYDNREELLEIHGNDGVLTNVLGQDYDNNKSAELDKNNTSFSVFQVQSSRISPSNKNTNSVAIFLNSIPTLELSQASPFFNITFQMPRPAISNDRVSKLSLVKFLEGAKNVNELGNADLLMVRGTSNDEDVFFSSGSSGIELFTSPQLLVNADISDSEEHRVVPVIDKFRPFATLESFDVDVTPAPGIMSYRTANLKFTLHDGSRLHELADFIKPDMYNQAEILVEYGWSHPALDSPWGAFLNALKVKEKYYVKNNNFSWKDNGEVLITLELYTKGALDTYTSNISDGEEVANTQVTIQKLQNKIAELRGRIFKQSDQFIKELRGVQILNAASDGNAELQLSQELRKELNYTLRSLEKQNSSDDAKQLRQSLLNLYGSGRQGNGGEAKKLSTSIGSAIKRKIDRVRRGSNTTSDPFFLEQLQQSDIKEEFASQYVSLAKLMLLFVVEPLVATKKFDDIQLLFYTFNDHAGLIGGPVGRRNIGSFAIDVDEFHSKYKQVAVTRRTANLTLRDFITFVNNSFVEDPANINYGMKRLYKPYKNIQDANILSREIEKVMKCQALIKDGIFKMPHLDVYVECVPEAIDEQILSQESRDVSTILRIHVFDKVASSYTSQGDMLAAARADSISTIGDVPVVDDPNNASKEDQQQAKNVIALAESRNLIRAIRGDDGKDKVYEVVGGPNKIKEFVSNTMPTVIYRANNTAVIRADMKSMTDARLSTINMIRSGEAGPLEPNGSSQGGLPMQVLPSQLDLTMHGCPIVDYAQQFFVDMQSGTTTDNIYTVTKISHKIESGKFQTQLGMVPLDAYGQYRSMIQKIGSAIRVLGDMIGEEETSGQTPENDTIDEDC